MIKWIILILLAVFIINDAVNFSTTDEFFTINFHIQKSLELLNSIKNFFINLL